MLGQTLHSNAKQISKNPPTYQERLSRSHLWASLPAKEMGQARCLDSGSLYSRNDVMSYQGKFFQRFAASEATAFDSAFAFVVASVTDCIHVASVTVVAGE